MRVGRIVSIVLAISVTVVIAAALMFHDAFLESPAIQTTCINDYGHRVRYTVGERVTPAFDTCVRARVELLLKYDYPESKDLAKSFLTLLTGLLLASITFSEKIVDFSRATWVPKSLMVACWLALLGAIIACGVGLAFMAQAAMWASHQPFREYFVFVNRAVYLFVIAGLAFGIGLATLLAAGVITLVHRPSSIQAVPVDGEHFVGSPAAEGNVAQL